jgi:hypothetical protein
MMAKNAPKYERTGPSNILLSLVRIPKGEKDDVPAPTLLLNPNVGVHITDYIVTVAERAAIK